MQDETLTNDEMKNMIRDNPILKKEVRKLAVMVKGDTPKSIHEYNKQAAKVNSLIREK